MTAVQFLLSAVGVIFAIIIISRIARSPLQVVFRLIRGLTISAIGLWFLNLIGQQIHLHVPYNPITIGVTGLLGIPGLIAILVLHTWIVH